MAGMRFCSCGTKVQGTTRCADCRPKDTQALHAAARGYDYQWQQLRLRVLADDPLCIDCEALGFVRPATEVHHLQTITERPDLRLKRSNLVPLCSACHGRRHDRGRNESPRGSF